MKKTLSMLLVLTLLATLLMTLLPTGASAITYCYYEVTGHWVITSYTTASIYYGVSRNNKKVGPFDKPEQVYKALKQLSQSNKSVTTLSRLTVTGIAGDSCAYAGM